MKKFEEWAKTEKTRAMYMGGYTQRKLEKALELFFQENHAKISERLYRVYSTSNPVLEVFGLCNTLEEMEEVAKDIEDYED